MYVPHIHSILRQPPYTPILSSSSIYIGFSSYQANIPCVVYLCADWSTVRSSPLSTTLDSLGIQCFPSTSMYACMAHMYNVILAWYTCMAHIDLWHICIGRPNIWHACVRCLYGTYCIYVNRRGERILRAGFGENRVL